MREKRSLFSSIFGRPRQLLGTSAFRMLNGFSPTFSNVSGEAYDSDAVRAAVDAIARNAGKLKPRHIRRKGGKIDYPDSNVERLLSVRPNKYMDAYSFYYKVVTALMMTNNAFIYIDWAADLTTAKGFYPVLASTVEFVESRNSPGQLLARFQFMGGQIVTLPYENLIHLRRYFYKQDLWGEINDKALTPTLQLIQTTDEGIANAVKSSAYLRGLLKFTSMLKREDMNKQRDDFVKDYMDLTNNGGIAATDAKAEYVPLNNDPKMIDAKLMEAIEKKVYKFFGVNEKIVMSTYSEDEWNAFYESVLEPLALQMSLEFTAKLFTTREQGHGNEIIFEANRLQYASTKTKLMIIETLVDRGLMNKNEGREIFNMGPIPDGEKYIVSLNFVQADKANQYQLGEQGGEEDDPSSSTGAEPEG